MSWSCPVPKPPLEFPRGLKKRIREQPFFVGTTINSDGDEIRVEYYFKSGKRKKKVL